MMDRSITTSSPIFVTGMPRSGTTFLQRLLSSHPEITICGQEPLGVCWGAWLQVLIEGISFAEQSNQQTQEMPPHYACGMDRETATDSFLTFIANYLAGEVATRRWGLKSLTNCRVVPDAIRQVWPEARWIVGVRDPFRSMESLRNTFDRDARISWSQMSDWWTASARFGQENCDAMLIQVDRLHDDETRQSTVENLFEFIGEEPTAEVWEFVADWPVIHKVVPDDERDIQLTVAEHTALLESDPEFQRFTIELGYSGLTTDVRSA